MCWSWALAWHSREPGLACQPGLVSRPTQATYWNMVSKKNHWGGDGWWFNRKYLGKETPVIASHSKAWFVLFIWSRILLWSLKLRAILLPQPTKCWNYRYELSHKPSSPTSPPKQTDWVLLSKLSFYFLTVLCAFFFFFSNTAFSPLWATFLLSHLPSLRVFLSTCPGYKTPVLRQGAGNSWPLSSRPFYLKEAVHSSFYSTTLPPPKNWPCKPEHHLNSKITKFYFLEMPEGSAVSLPDRCFHYCK